MFLILIAVALFAALSYAVTSSSRTGGSQITDDKAKIVAAQILQILNRTTTDLQRFLLMEGYSIENIDIFSPGKTALNKGDTDSCTEDECNLLHPNGGGSPVPLLPASFDYGDCSNYRNGNQIMPYIMIVGVREIGSELPEIVLYYCGIDLRVCDYINHLVGTKDLSDDSALVFSLGSKAVSYEGFDDDHTNPMFVTTPNRIGASDPRIRGKTTVCNASGQSARLVHVIYER